MRMSKLIVLLFVTQIVVADWYAVISPAPPVTPPEFSGSWTNAVATDPETGLAVDGWIVVVRFNAAPPTVFMASDTALGTTTYDFSGVAGIQAATNPEWRVYSTINGYAAAPVTAWQSF